MSDQNPYAVSESSQEHPLTPEDPSLHPQMQELIRLLRETRPWVRFIGVLIMIGFAAIVMLGAGMLLMAATGAVNRELAFIGALYLALSPLYGYPALCLNRYASAISRAESSREMADVVSAVLQQKKFWRYCGIVLLAIFGAYALVVFIGALVAVFG